MLQILQPHVPWNNFGYILYPKTNRSQYWYNHETSSHEISVSWKHGFGAWTGPSLRCRYTSGRDSFRPYGNIGYFFVKTGNTLGCRVCLLLLVCCYMQVRWLLEQPSGSCFSKLPSFQTILQLLDVTLPKVCLWSISNLWYSCLLPILICEKSIYTPLVWTTSALNN